MKASKIALASFCCLAFLSCTGKEDLDTEMPENSQINQLNECPFVIETSENVNRFFVVNSQRELNKVLLFPVDGSNQNCQKISEEIDIDFSKYTILLGKARLTAVKGKLLSQRVERDANGIYNYYVEIMNGGYTAIGQFRFGVIVSKIDSPSNVRLHVSIKDYTE